MKVNRIAGALGAEILGVDLRSLTDADVAEIRAAWLEHLVVFFRDQPLSPPEYMAFARRIGEPIEYPFVKGIPGFPEIVEVKKLEYLFVPCAAARSRLTGRPATSARERTTRGGWRRKVDHPTYPFVPRG